MKGLGVFLIGIAVFMFARGNYEVDLGKGILRASNKEDKITQEFQSGNFQQFSAVSNSIEGYDSMVTPQGVRFHARNRLKNNDLLIVKRKIFGSNLRDGYRFIFYFYGANDLTSMTDIMNGELGMQGKYHIHNYKRGDKYSWMEVRSNYVLLQ
jgi:hypothetical protein